MATTEKIKKLPFFKFDTDDWLIGKIQLVSHELKGVFIDFISQLWRENGIIKNDRFLANKLKASSGTLEIFLKDLKDLEIIVEKDGFLSVKFIDKQLNDYSEYLKNCTENGKKAKHIKKGASAKDKDKEKEDIKEKDKKEISEKPEGAKPLTASNEMIQAAERISNKHPRLTKPQRTQFEIIAAINRAIEKEIPVDKAIKYLEAQTEQYAEAVSKWPKQDRQYIVNSENWYKDGCYSEDPELWKRDGGKSDDDNENNFVH